MWNLSPPRAMVCSEHGGCLPVPRECLDGMVRASRKELSRSWEVLDMITGRYRDKSGSSQCQTSSVGGIWGQATSG